MSKNTQNKGKEKVNLHIKYVQILIIYVLALAFLSQNSQSIIQLDNSSGAYAWNGTYTSQVYDAGFQNVTWKNMTWTQVNASEEIQPDSSTVLLMHFNNQSAYGENSTRVYDFSGRGNNGTVNGSAVWNSIGKIGGAFQFDGINDYVDAGNNPSLSPSNYTLSVWVKLDSYATDKFIVSFGNASNDGFHLAEEPSGGNKLAFFHGGSGHGGLAYTNTIPNLGEWYNIVCIYNGINRTIYVNGILENTITGSGYGAPTTNLTIGKSGGASTFFNGSIDEVALWNRSLSASEISNLYSSGAKRGAIRLQSRTSNDNSSWSNWRTTYQGTTINQSGRYFQYQAFLQTYDNTTTPILYNVTIEKDLPLSGWINITVGSYTQSCIGYEFCNMQFLFGNGQLSGGNYTVTVLGHNSSSYFDESNSTFNYHFEEQAATANIVASTKTIADLSTGQDYNYLWNITLNNSEKSTMYNQSIIGLKYGGGIGVTATIVNTTCAVGGLWTWTNKIPASYPIGRYNPSMAYDSDNKVMIMYGGRTSIARTDETWMYNFSTNNWTNKAPSSPPSARENAAMAYDTENKVMVIYGGSNTGFISETWIYNLSNNSWTNKTPSTSPGLRTDHVMAYDTENKVMVMFGGRDGSYKSDTWIYNLSNNSWTNKTPSSAPTGRSSHTMVYDSNSKVMIMYGGNTGSVNAETWIYNLTNNTWTNKAPAVYPPARYDHTMAYDSYNNVTIMHGGWRGPIESDTWTYNLNSNTWTNQTISNPPIKRYLHAMAYDTENKATIMYGGNNGTYLNDTWMLDVVLDFNNDLVGTIPYSSNCTTEFNITVPGTATIGQYDLMWNASWNNRNGSATYYEETKVNSLRIIGNPNFVINTSSINQTGNISQALRTSILINNTGNTYLQPVQITVVGTGSSPMPASWLTFNPAVGHTTQWDGANNKWNQVPDAGIKILIANLTVTDYHNGTYTGIINISGRCIAADCGGEDVYIWQEINITTTISPNFTVSTSMILANENLSSTANKTFYLDNIGNSPITNVTINITGINSSWITFIADQLVDNTWTSLVEGTQKLVTILINIGSFFKETYNGVINITTAEGLYQEINFTIDVNPNATTNITTYYDMINHSKSKAFGFKVDSNGNTKILNMNITYQPDTMPASWIKKIIPNYTAQIVENSYQNVVVNITVPLAQAPGNYSGIIKINSTNVEDRLINLTVEVPIYTYWYFTPTYNISKEFILNYAGQVGNFTIYNPGNINKTYQLSYAQTYGPKTVNADCGVACGYSNPSNVTVPMQGSTLVKVYQSGRTSSMSEDVVTVTISDVNSSPSTNYVYMSINITNTPPVIIFNGTKLDMWTQTPAYAELNETLMPWIHIGDDESNGVNQSSIKINITKPSGTILNYDSTNITATYEDLRPDYQNSVHFNITVGETDEAGNYTVWFYVEDKSNQQKNSTFKFEVYNSTNMSLSSAGVTVSGVNKTTGVNSAINITLNNLGLTRAYEINITGNITQANALAENFTYTGLYIENFTKNSSGTYLINITAPPRSLGTYYFTPNILWKNKGGNYVNKTQTPIAITVSSNPTFDITPDAQELILSHGSSIVNNFTITPTGNDNLSIYTVQTQAGYDHNLTITYTPQSGSSVFMDSVKTILTNISLAQFADGSMVRTFITRFTAGVITKTFEINITTPPDDSWTVDRTNLTINAVAEQFGKNNMTQIRHVGTGGLSLNYIFELTGDITNITNLESSGVTLNANETYNIPINYTALQNNNIYYGQIKINATEHDVKYVNVTIISGFYDLQVRSLEKPSAIVENDTINESVSVYYATGYLTENITYKIYINNTLCPTTSSYVVDEKTYILCDAPYKTDATTYDITTFANYTGPNGEVDIYVTNRTIIYYKDITPPTITYHQENDTQYGNNITLIANASDNLAVSSITAEVTDPNGTRTNYTLVSTNGLYKRSLNMTEKGIHTVKYIVNDTTGNIEQSTTGDYEIYEDKTYYGVIADQTGVPFLINFSLTNAATGDSINFSTNATGHYNITIKTRVYDMYMTFDNYKINLSSVNFFILDTDILDMDRLSAADISGELIGGKSGLSIISKMPNSGILEVTYGNLTINSKDNLRVYSCQDYNFTTRKCGSTWWIQLPSVNNKITNVITSEIANFANTTSAFSLAEVEPAPGPVMSLPFVSIYHTATHGRSTNYTYEVDSIGQTSLQNIQATCKSGNICTTINVSSNTIASLLPGARGYLDLNITVPSGTAPGNYTGLITISANSVTSQDVTTKIEVLPDRRFTYSFSNTVVTVGSNIRGTLGNVTITNNGNLNENISFETGLGIENITGLTPLQTISRSIIYFSPKTIGMNNYTINITDWTTSNMTSASVNVTHVVNATFITSTNNLVAGNQISVNAQANYLGTLGGANWTATIDDSTCAITSSALNSFTCTLPSMSSRISHNLSIRGEFQGGHAYDIILVNYSDLFGPEILYHNNSANNTGMLAQVDAVAYDENGINATTTATFIAPSGATIAGTIGISGNIITAMASLTELGDYNISYVLYDNLGNQRTLLEEFEFYEERIFSGSIRNTLGEGIKTEFKLYRCGTDTVLKEFNTTNDGNYSELIHKRMYDVEMITANMSVRLNDVNLTSVDDPLKIDNVPVNLVSIPNAKDHIVFGFQSIINNTGTITISMNYNSQEINNINNIYIYKCDDWDFAERLCNSNWTAQNGTRGSNLILANISGFSAYAVAESNLEIPPNTIVYTTTQQTIQQTTQQISYTTTASSGGGGGGVSGVSTSQMQELLDQLKEDIFGKTEAITEKVEEISQKSKDVAIDTSQITRQMYSGENSRTKMHVKNDKNDTIQLIAQVSGDIIDMISIKNPIIELEKGEEGDFEVGVNVPIDMTPGIYTGEIKILMGNKVVSKIPTEVRVLESKDQLLDLKVQPLSDTTSPGKPAKVQVDVYNLGKSKRVDIQLKLELVDPEFDKIVSQIEESIAVETTISVIKTLPVPENTPLRRYLIRGTSYYTNNNKSMHAQSLAYLKVENPWYKQKLFGIIPAWTILLGFLFVALSVASIEIYMQIQKRKKKYQIQVEYKELPQPSERTSFIGNIAETSVRTFFELDKMQTHSIIAGASGGGKSVAAQVLVEEALKKGVAVIVFDPTAQWTGFLRKSREKVMLKQYRNFGMKVADSRGFAGNIHPVTNALEIIDIKKFINPGEINIFTINRLDPKDIDIFVANTIKEVFHANLGESQELKLLLVYDEVHRLLPKFGGSGEGFLQIERACREFRKWGVGLMLISQVLSDFVGSIKANIGTEMQMRTRDEGDLERIKTKYGEDIMKSIVKATVGTGMIENAEYNKGRAYFVSFRPLLHSIARLSDEELSSYNKYNEKIDDIDYQIEQLEKEGIDVFDLKLELKLALDKLKEGSFSMVDIYLESLVPRITEIWTQLGKKPKKRQMRLANLDEIKKDIEKAKKERDKITKESLDSQKQTTSTTDQPRTEPATDETAKSEDDSSAKNKSEQAESTQAQTKDLKAEKEKKLEQLRKYINSQIAKKVPKATLKKALIAHGWKEEDINQIMGVEKTGKEDNAPAEKTTSTRTSETRQAETTIKTAQAKPQSASNTSSENSGSGGSVGSSGGSGLNIDDLEARLDAIKTKMGELKKAGKDTSLTEIKIMSIPSDLHIAKLTRDQNDLKRIDEKLTKVETSLNR